LDHYNSSSSSLKTTTNNSSSRFNFRNENYTVINRQSCKAENAPPLTHALCVYCIVFLTEAWNLYWQSCHFWTCLKVELDLWKCVLSVVAVRKLCCWRTYSPTTRWLPIVSLGGLAYCVGLLTAPLLLPTLRHSCDC